MMKLNIWPDNLGGVIQQARMQQHSGKESGMVLDIVDAIYPGYGLAVAADSGLFAPLSLPGCLHFSPARFGPGKQFVSFTLHLGNFGCIKNASSNSVAIFAIEIRKVGHKLFTILPVRATIW